MGHYSCLFGRELNLSSEHCTIAERVATHISHIAMRAFLDFTDHLPKSVSDSIRPLLSQISQCSPPVGLTSPGKNPITPAKSITQSQSEISSKSTQDIRSKTLKYLLSSTTVPPLSPLAASQVPFWHVEQCSSSPSLKENNIGLLCIRLSSATNVKVVPL